MRKPEKELLQALKCQGLTLSVAESCTGGLISKRITDISGASDVYLGGVAAYSNNVKMKILNVPGDLLARFGAVSEEVAGAMAKGVRTATASDIAVSTTGIAGPGGGSLAKPVGTVCFGFVFPDGTVTFTEFFKGNREKIRNKAAQCAVRYLIDYLKSQSSHP